MSRPTAKDAPRFGAWTLGRISWEASQCGDCKTPLPKGAPAWRSVTGGAWGRRICEPCMAMRQGARRATP